MALIRGTARTTEQVQEQYDAAFADVVTADELEMPHATARVAVYGWALGRTERTPVTGGSTALTRPALAAEYLASAQRPTAQNVIAGRALQWLIGVEPTPPRLPEHAARA